MVPNMKSFNTWFKKMSWLQIVIMAILLVFIFVDTPIPREVLTFLGSPVGIILLIALVFMSFVTLGPLIGVFMILVVYELLRRTGMVTNNKNVLDKMLNAPSKSYDDNQSLSAMNQFPITLEEEVIHNMIPLVKGDLGPKTYKPTTSEMSGVSDL